MPVRRRKRAGRKRHRRMRSAILKRGIYISGLRTTVSLEEAFWDALQNIAVARGTTRVSLIAQVRKRKHANFSSALRLFVIGYYRRQWTQVSR